MDFLSKIFWTFKAYWNYGFIQIISQYFPEKHKLEGSKTLVILVDSFPPQVSGGVYRSAALAHYAKEAGYKLVVYTTLMQEQPSIAGLKMLEYLGSDIEIHHINTHSEQPSVSLFPKLDGGLLGAIKLFLAMKKTWVRNSHSVIFATGPTFNVFVAGYWASQYFNLPLFLDYRDEWTLCPFGFVAKGKFDSIWEQRCLRQAQQVLFTTESQKLALTLLYPHITELSAKSFVIANGWEPKNREVTAAHGRNNLETVELVFAGTLGEHIQIEPFLRLLKDVLDDNAHLRNQLRISFIGRKQAKQEALLAQFPYQEVILSIPLVSVAEAAQYMDRADALLLILDEKYKRYLPGKLYEYLAAKKPIIVFDDDGGESSRLVQQLDAGWMVGTHNLPEFLEIIHLLAKGDLPRFQNLEAWLQLHTREALSQKIIIQLDSAFAAMQLSQ